MPVGIITEEQNLEIEDDNVWHRLDQDSALFVMA